MRPWVVNTMVVIAFLGGVLSSHLGVAQAAQEPQYQFDVVDTTTDTGVCTLKPGWEVVALAHDNAWHHNRILIKRRIK
jgi:hypothetical protein